MNNNGVLCIILEFKWLAPLLLELYHKKIKITLKKIKIFRINNDE